MEDGHKGQGGNDPEPKKGNLYKKKLQCNNCRYIGYELVCPQCDHSYTMFEYKNPLSGIKLK